MDGVLKRGRGAEERGRGTQDDRAMRNARNIMEDARKPDPALHAKEIYEDRKLVEVSNVKESVPVEAEAGLTHVLQLLKLIHAYQHDVEQTATRH